MQELCENLTKYNKEEYAPCILFFILCTYCLHFGKLSIYIFSLYILLLDVYFIYTKNINILNIIKKNKILH